MQNLKKAEARILSLLELEDGWDYGKGVKINEDNVWLAIAIAREINGEHVDNICAFPTDDGLVDLKFFLKNNIKIGLFIDVEAGEITSYVEAEGIDDFEVVKIEGVKKHIQKKIERYKNNVIWKITKKSMQDYYIKDIFQTSMDLISPQFLSLEDLAVEAHSSAGYPLLTRGAQKSVTARCADTSKLMRAHMADWQKGASSGLSTQSGYRRIG